MIPITSLMCALFSENPSGRHMLRNSKPELVLTGAEERPWLLSSWQSLLLEQRTFEQASHDWLLVKGGGSGSAADEVPAAQHGGLP